VVSYVAINSHIIRTTHVLRGIFSPTFLIYRFFKRERHPKQSYVCYFLEMMIFSNVPNRDVGGWFFLLFLRARAPNRAVICRSYGAFVFICSSFFYQYVAPTELPFLPYCIFHHHRISRLFFHKHHYLINI
jgi:hypothetical protein